MLLTHPYQYLPAKVNVAADGLSRVEAFRGISPMDYKELIASQEMNADLKALLLQQNTGLTLQRTYHPVSF